MDYWLYHTKGDPECEACVMDIEACLYCGGQVHSHLEDDLVTLIEICENCGELDSLGIMLPEE